LDGKPAETYAEPSTDSPQRRTALSDQHVSAPICQPSRSALMTGRVPHRSGALGFNPVKEGTPTLVTVLQAAGYLTAGINKLPHMMPESCFPWDVRLAGSGKIRT
jgi:N-sulfoglucosamine sulfohydrolase